jgi:hypothetical protein
MRCMERAQTEELTVEQLLDIAVDALKTIAEFPHDSVMHAGDAIEMGATHGCRKCIADKARQRIGQTIEEVPF